VPSNGAFPTFQLCLTEHILSDVSKTELGVSLPIPLAQPITTPHPVKAFLAGSVLVRPRPESGRDLRSNRLTSTPPRLRPRGVQCAETRLPCSRFSSRLPTNGARMDWRSQRVVAPGEPQSGGGRGRREVVRTEIPVRLA
jgi:hypothetical protein